MFSEKQGQFSSIFEGQPDRLRELVAEAISISSIKTPGLKPVAAQLLSGILNGDAALSNAALYHGLSNETLACAEANETQAAYAWGRAAYVSQRRFAHAWLLPLRFAFASGNLKQIPLLQPPTALPDVRGKISPGIMQYWDTPAVPPDVKTLIEGWTRQGSRYSHVLFNDDMARAYIADHYGKTITTAYDALPFVASKSDLFRLCWILREGGVYVDADEQAAGELNTLLPPEAGLVMNWTDASTPCVNNWFIASRPHHPIIAYALNLALSHIAGSKAHNIKLSAWILTGPGVITMSIMDMLCSRTFNQSDFADVGFHSETDFRTVSIAQEDLVYKKDPTKNWRLSGSN
jgi:hypothetical protein